MKKSFTTMKKHSLTILFFWLFTYSLSAQVINGQDTLYGNEWINFDQEYFKIKVAEDGIYSVDYQQLVDAGFPVAQVPGSQYSLFHNGVEVPVYTTSDNVFSSSDHFEFYGRKNRSELDRHLFQNPDEEMMNPLYSLFTDTSAYFLTWTDVGSPKRFEEVENDLNNLGPSEEYYMETLVLNFDTTWGKEQNGQGIQVSNFTMAEGFSSLLLNIQSVTLEPTSPFLNGLAANLYVRYSGNLKQHRQEISLNGQLLKTDNYYGYEVRTLDTIIDSDFLANNIELTFEGKTDNNDKQRISNVILTYPRLFQFENASSYGFEISPASDGKYIEITDFDTGNNPVLYDITNDYRQPVNVQNGTVRINLLPSTESRSLVLVNTSSGVKNAVIEPVEFIDYADENAEFIILSNPKLYNDGNGNNYVEEYADYRRSQQGGGYETIVVDVQQLYDQFGWGINRHSLSILNFGHFVKKNWDNPSFFFILGKGREYQGIRTEAKLLAANSFYVPSFGSPGADNLLLSTKSTTTPIIPIGRLASSDPNDIKLFLRKVKDHELNANNDNTIEDRQWLKEIIHLGGGSSASEQSLIKSNLQNLETRIENNGFGGNVSSFFKTSTDPIQISQSQQIFDRINDGTSIITFFGHSAVGTFDFNIDNPDNYNNFKKYPVIFSLGCFSGNIHTGGIGISERFVFQEDKAALGMVATSGQGYISSLNSFMGKFYDYLGDEFYGKSIGEILQQTIFFFDEFNSTQPELLQQLTYHGDPSVTLIAAPGPDYLVDNESVEIEPNVVSVNQDSFSLKFGIVNIGRNLGDSMVIKIEHELPDGNRFLAKEFKIAAPGFVSEHEVTISTVGSNAVGLNTLYVTVDAENEIAEYPDPAAEMNNQLVNSNGQYGITFFIRDNTANPVFPSEFGIIGTPSVTLKASTADPLAPEQKYILQIDTSEFFNSPVLEETQIIQTGGLIEWQPNIVLEEGKAYYWRVSPDSIPGTGYAWQSSSFSYLDQVESGWSQRHYFQFLDNRMEDMELNENDRRFSFLEDFKDFRIKNKVFNASDPPNGFINGVRWSDFFRWNIHESLTVVVFDTQGKIWFNFKPGEYGSVNTNAARIGAFPFPVANVSQRNLFIEFIENVIPDDHWVFVYTAQRNLSSDLDIDEWEQDSVQLGGKNIFNVLEAQGALEARSLKDNLTPYLFAFRKNTGPIGERKADLPTGTFNFEFPIPGLWFEGNIESPPIGPAQNWNKLSFEFDTSDLVLEDTFFVRLYGLSQDQQEVELIADSIKQTEYFMDQINADSFPFIKLEFITEDISSSTPVQLKNWNIFYDPLPDAAINPAKGYAFHADTLQEGEVLKLDYTVSPTNGLPMDSLLVEYQIREKSGDIVFISKREGDLKADQDLNITLEYPTEGLTGEHQLIVEINHNSDQPELYGFNNFLLEEFFINDDRINPLLDVTFDGKHIINGDIVSPQPEIKISLTDENQFLLLNDTSSFKLFLLSPDGSLMGIPINSPEVDFLEPAGSGPNKATIMYRPTFTEDGQYSFIVQASDISGNMTSEIDYKISFQVVLESMFSNVLAYPNPFSTSTRFVYTLTGLEPPAFYKIQIMTISGRIVREITQQELGPLKIGTHETDFVWDGTDEFGDRLANGIYLYRVTALDQDRNEIKKFETSADSFFSKGVGKIAIIR
ncbi:MAG: C25 family cysteine peptidase [Bacteroidota bacterium]